MKQLSPENEDICGGWRDGCSDEDSGCSSRRLKLESQHPHAAMALTPVPGFLKVPLASLGTKRTPVYMQAKCPFTSDTDKYLKKKEPCQCGRQSNTNSLTPEPVPGFLWSTAGVPKAAAVGPNPWSLSLL